MAMKRLRAFQKLKVLYMYGPTDHEELCFTQLTNVCGLFNLWPLTLMAESSTVREQRRLHDDLGQHYEQSYKNLYTKFEIACFFFAGIKETACHK